MSFLQRLLIDIADAIRIKDGTGEEIQPWSYPDRIKSIPTGKIGIPFLSITYNDDNTVTFIDRNYVERTMKCTYDKFGRLSSVNMDGIAHPVIYDENDWAVAVGDTKIDLKNKIYADALNVLIGDVTSIQQELKATSDIIGGKK